MVEFINFKGPTDQYNYQFLHIWDFQMVLHISLVYVLTCANIFNNISAFSTTAFKSWVN